MGKNKNGFSLFEAYLAAGMASSSNTTEHVPLPDSMRTSTLIEQIGKEHNWSDEQINEDIHILECNRLYYVKELRELSNSSWKVNNVYSYASPPNITLKGYSITATCKRSPKERLGA
ncbi:hypothetical protein RMCBS344292_16657 [Rhizopus microsporus]|nr:hypothetical protein RMCBS344292_16657 [Rhizopus microsporus]